MSHPALESLKLLRLERGWTFRETAEKISALCPPGRGITYASVHALLSGRRSRPTELTIFKVRRFLVSEGIVERVRRRPRQTQGAAR